MRTTLLARRLLPTLSLLAVGFYLGGAFATAGAGDAPVIDLDTYDAVLDVDGTVVVEGSRGFVAFTDEERQSAKVEVRGWDALAKRGLVTAGSTVRVTGANAQGKKVEYRGHVTVLK